MRCACVDIGSNTARLLVADVSGALPREVVARKVHTHLGRALRAGEGDTVAPRLAEVVAAHVAAAREAGASRLRVVATSALRESPAGDALCAAVRAVAGVPVDVLTGADEARLAFLGATCTAPTGAGGTGWSRLSTSDVENLDHRAGVGDAVPAVAVVDVGGGSTELAVGAPGSEPGWTASLPVGSGRLDLPGDPPDAGALAAAAEAARAALATVLPPPVTRALAVGGSAASLARIAGRRLDPLTVASAVATLTAAPAEEVAARTGLEPDRVRLLPAGLLVLAAASERLGLPLELGCGGLREGVCLALAADPLDNR